MRFSYVALIGAAQLSSKEKQYGGRNFEPIIIKLGTNVGLIKTQFEIEGELCGADRKGRTFLQRKVLRRPRGRNFDPIITKFDTRIGLIKLQIKFGDNLCGANRRTFL